MNDDELFAMLRQAYLERVAEEKRDENLARVGRVVYAADFAMWEQELEEAP